MLGDSLKQEGSKIRTHCPGQRVGGEAEVPQIDHAGEQERHRAGKAVVVQCEVAQQRRGLPDGSGCCHGHLQGAVQRVGRQLQRLQRAAEGDQHKEAGQAADKAVADEADGHHGRLDQAVVV